MECPENFIFSEIHNSKSKNGINILFLQKQF